MDNRVENGTYSSADREAELIGYLPDFLAGFRELKAVMDAEDPEFRELAGEIKAVRNAGFFDHCGERFLSRFEDMLGIYSVRGEELEDRRQRVLLRWNEAPPYTLEALRKKLALVCGESGFSLAVDCEGFTLNVETSVFSNAVLLEIERLLARIVPANIVVNAVNRVSCESDSRFAAGGIVRENFGFEVASETNAEKSPRGSVVCGGFLSVHNVTEIF